MQLNLSPAEHSRPPPPVPLRIAIRARHPARPAVLAGRTRPAPRGEAGPAGTLVRGGGSRPEREVGSLRAEPGRTAASFRAAPSVLRLRVARNGPGPGERAAGARPHRRYSVRSALREGRAGGAALKAGPSALPGGVFGAGGAGLRGIRARCRVRPCVRAGRQPGADGRGVRSEPCPEVSRGGWRWCCPCSELRGRKPTAGWKVDGGRRGPDF